MVRLPWREIRAQPPDAGYDRRPSPAARAIWHKIAEAALRESRIRTAAADAKAKVAKAGL